MMMVLSALDAGGGGSGMEPGAVIAIIIGVAGGMIGLLARISINSYTKKIDEQSAEIKAIDARLHAEEKATIRQDGDIRLIAKDHTNLEKDMTEVKENMATKKDIESLEKMVERGFENLRQPSGPGYRVGKPPTFPSGSSYTGITPKSDPPKRER